MQRHRLNLSARLLLVLSGIAAFSTVVALALQDRVLSGDLRKAAAARLERAARAADHTADAHVEALADRYRSISGTPQFRANLEIRDEPTLRFYARELAARERAAVVAFLDPEGRTLAVAGDRDLAARVGAGEASLLAHGGALYAVAAVPLRTGGVLRGRLVAAERVDDAILARWSELCGAEILFDEPRAPGPGRVLRDVRRFGDRVLRVATDLDAERAAIAHSRTNLLLAGGLALGLAFAASIVLARGLVRPILAIQQATERIGQGDLDVPVDSQRLDEVGDVARAFELMRTRLRDTRRQVQEQQSVLEAKVRELASSQAGLANAQRLARLGSWQIDLESRRLGGSDELRVILGLRDDGKPIDPETALDRVHPDDRAAVRETVETCMRQGSPLRIDFRIALPDDVEKIVHAEGEIEPGDDGAPSRMAGTIQDVTERRRTEEQIRFLAYHDGLTGLGNRLLFKERLEMAIAQARRNDGLLGILYLDLDQFKRINETLGHSTGDALLKAVADRLVQSVRETDVIARHELGSAISRLGGDEFTILLTDLAEVRDLSKVARRTLDALSRPFELDGHQVVVTGSIGITAWPSDGDDAETLLRNADAAMYHVKDQGRNGYQYFAQSMNELALRGLVLEQKLRRGLERGEFELHYQPKVSLATAAVTGVEALARWRDPEEGIISPAEFIPIAEETGLVVPLGDWALREACEQIVRWREEGHAPIPVSVNVSVQQFRGGRIVEKLTRILSETGADASLLEIEITESTLLQDERAVVTDLERLRALGIRISVDDFGTGYSSFAYLRQLPVDALKIDRAFVKNIESERDDAALAAAIVSMGKALRLRVIAEGVETSGQRELLAQWGCDEMQGFLYSAALPAQSVTWYFSGGGRGR